jgi:hypothetical protein
MSTSKKADPVRMTAGKPRLRLPVELAVVVVSLSACSTDLGSSAQGGGGEPTVASTGGTAGELAIGGAHTSGGTGPGGTSGAGSAPGGGNGGASSGGATASSATASSSVASSSSSASASAGVGGAGGVGGDGGSAAT